MLWRLFASSPLVKLLVQPNRSIVIAIVIGGWREGGAGGGPPPPHYIHSCQKVSKVPLFFGFTRWVQGEWQAGRPCTDCNTWCDAQCCMYAMRLQCHASVIFQRNLMYCVVVAFLFGVPCINLRNGVDVVRSAVLQCASCRLHPFSTSAVNNCHPQCVQPLLDRCPSAISFSRRAPQPLLLLNNLLVQLVHDPQIADTQAVASHLERYVVPDPC